MVVPRPEGVSIRLTLYRLLTLLREAEMCDRCPLIGYSYLISSVILKIEIMLISSKGVLRASIVSIEGYSNACRRLGHPHFLQLLIWLD